MIPNEYLYYYDFANEALTGNAGGPRPRGVPSRQQDAFYARLAASPAETLRSWEESLAEREGSYMEEAWTRPRRRAARRGGRPGRPAATAGCRSISSTR